ncbi:YuzD family protein [Bacillus sp. AGMB 02131]|uniref:YuzD family protein n=1 Tax=Peribacillus faecalis TaxID=2772559 RepID=A0A927HBX2_9BACI|nr:YuzD family protein [Peribacillus faecalis]MBD3109042.1 YuzD family protein [Peribacillus faecalis]
MTREESKVEIIVYGAEQICASCVNLPSSKDTYEWLEAALGRKFPGQHFTVSYVDIYKNQEDPEKAAFSERVIEEDLFYPVVVIKDEIVGEGNPKLKEIVKEMEKYGYTISE